MTGRPTLALMPMLLMGACQPLPLASIPPVCARPEVVTFLNTRLRMRDPYEEVVPATVQERTGPAGAYSTCTVLVRQPVFDTPLYGNAPAVSVRAVFYVVREASGGGLVVETVPR